MLRLADRDGLPAFCLTSLRPLPPAAPSAAYLRTILAGLADTFGWDAQRCADYLLRAAGVAPAWSAGRLVALAESTASPARGSSAP